MAETGTTPTTPAWIRRLPPHLRRAVLALFPLVEAEDAPPRTEGPGRPARERAAVEHEISHEAAVLARLTDGLAPALRRAVLGAVRATATGVSQAAIERALERGDRSAAYAALGWDEIGEPALRGEFLGEWRAGFEAAAHATAAQIAPPPIPPDVPPAGAPGAPGEPPRPFEFEVLNPRPLRFLERHGAALVTEISEPVREALRESLAQMTRQGWDVRTAAKDLMRHIGLTSRLATANRNFRLALEDKGLAPSVVDRRVGQHARRLLLYRATMIARTESKYATGNGQRIAWAEAVAAGRLDPRIATVIWETAADEIVCPVCGPMHRQMRTLEQLERGEFFVAGDGREVEMPGDTHPQCRCSRSMRARGILRGRLGDVVRVRAQERIAA